MFKLFFYILYDLISRNDDFKNILLCVPCTVYDYCYCYIVAWFLFLYNQQSQWLPVSYPIVPPSTSTAPRRPTANASTQTVGLFYPSDRELAKKKEQEEEKMSFEKQLRDRRPLLTAVSPGKGGALSTFVVTP